MPEPEFLPDQHQVLVRGGGVGVGEMGWEGRRRQRGRIILGRDKNLLININRVLSPESIEHIQHSRMYM